MGYRRGIKTHNEIAENSTTQSSSTNKGRSRELIIARNHCLLHRYYYYAKLLHWPYELVVAELQKEFFLSIDTIPRIVEQLADQIGNIAAKGTTVKMMEKEFPAMKWNHKPIETKIKIPVREVYKGY